MLYAASEIGRTGRAFASRNAWFNIHGVTAIGGTIANVNHRQLQPRQQSMRETKSTKRRRRSPAAGTRIANGALVLCATLAALLAVEAYLHYFHNYRGVQIKVIDGKTYDHRDTRSALYDLFSAGQDAYPIIPPATYRKSLADAEPALLPLGGISRTTTAFCNELQKFIIYESDRFGFNNENQIWDNNPRVLILGDSFAHGACVPRSATIAENLSCLHAPTVSLGYNGNGPLLELAGLIEFGTHLRPDMVVWMFYEGNDLPDLASEIDSPLLRHYLTSEFSQGLMQRQPDVDYALRSYVAQLPEYRNVKIAARTSSDVQSIIRFRSTRAMVRRVLSVQEKQRKQQAYAVRSAKKYDVSDLTRVLERAHEITRSWGGALVFVYVPQWDRYTGGDTVNPNRDDVIRVVQELGIPLIDLHSHFVTLERPADLYAYPDRNGHFNERGYLAVGEFLARRLEAAVKPGS